MAIGPDDDADGAELTERPASDELARKVARSKIAGKLFAKHEPVRLGRYHLLEQVGAGGMGVVWGAWDPELDRRVAIKLVKTELSRARERIVREGQALAKLSHPNVVPIYDVGVLDEQVYLVMEWVRGENLRVWAGTPRTPREIAAAYRAAAQGLAAAHAAGLIHRDFKPENAMMGSDGRVRVLDFGLALDHSEASEGGRAGTPLFMAPEQLDGEPVPASDQYAVGVSLQGALGKNPPRWLAEIIARATATAPDQRYPSMDALADALGRDPAVVRRRRVFVAAALALAGGAFAIGTLRSGEAVEHCTGGAGEIAGVWNVGMREGIAAHLRMLGPYGMEVARTLPGELDGYADAWALAHRDACRASERAELTPDLYAATLGCLARSRVGLATTAEVLARTTGARLPDGIVAVRGLAMPEACRTESETSTVAPPPRAIATQVMAVDGQVVRARLLALAVDPRAIETAEAAARDADALHYAALIGRAQLVRGFAHLMQQERIEATAAFDLAMSASLEAGDTATAVEAIARKLFALATRAKASDERTISEVRATLAVAEPLALGLHAGAGFPRALLLNNAGTIALARQDVDAARGWFEKALRARPAGTTDGVELASIVGNLGLVSPDPAKRDELFQRESSEIAAALGVDHPLALDARIRAAMFIEHPGRAREQLRAACGRYRSLHPRLTERARQCTYELVWLAVEQEDLSDAARELATLGSGREGELRLGVGFRLLLDGNWPGLESAMTSLASELLAEKHFWRRWRGVDALLLVATAQQRSGSVTAATATLDRALSVMSELDGLKATTFFQRRSARIHAMLARLGASGDHKRDALAWYRGAGGYDREVAELEALTD